MKIPYEQWRQENRRHITSCAAGNSFTCKENRASLHVINDQATPIDFILLDGGVFPNGDCCDWLVAEIPHLPTAKAALIELKGRGVEKAIHQLETTIVKLCTQIASGLKLSQAIIVSQTGHIPATRYQKAEMHFLRTHDVQLKRRKGHCNSSEILSGRKTQKK